MILRRNEKNSSSMDKICVAGEVSPAKATPKRFITKTPPPSPPARSTPSRPEMVEEVDVEVTKPFFIMDWLEQIDPADLQLAQRMLKTPQKPKDVDHENLGPAASPNSVAEPCSGTLPLEEESSIIQPRVLFQASTSSEDVNCGPFQKTKASSSLSGPVGTTTKGAALSSKTPSSGAASYYRRRSIAVGNGWNAKGLSKARQGLWQDALACWENALQVRTQVLGEQHIDVANTANNMGIAYGKLQRPQQAMAMLQMALEIRQQHYGLKHAEVAATLHNIGNVLQQCGELGTAIQYFGRAMHLQQDLLGSDHALVARAGMAMGHAYYQGKLYPQALTAYSEALAIFELLQDKQGGGGADKQEEGEGTEDYSAEIEATRADVQELKELIHYQAASAY